MSTKCHDSEQGSDMLVTFPWASRGQSMPDPS